MDSLSSSPDRQKKSPKNANSALPLVLAFLMSSTAAACNSATNDDSQRVREARERLEQADRDLQASERALEETNLSVKRSESRLAMLHMKMSPQQAVDMIIEAKKNYKQALASGKQINIDVARNDLQHAKIACEYAKSGYFTRNGKYPKIECK